MELPSSTPESEQFKNPYAAALEYLFDNNEELGTRGITTAYTLYETLCSPTPAHIKVLDLAITSINCAELTDIAARLAGKGEGSKEDFLEGLGSLIQNEATPHPQLNADAIHFAYSVGAWELESAVNSISDALLELSGNELTKWGSVLAERSNFRYQMRLSREYKEMQEASTAPSQPQTPVRSTEPVLSKAVLDFIGTLDMDDI